MPKKAVHSEPEQNQSDRYLEVAEWNHGPEENGRQDHRPNRQAMPQRDGQERAAHRAAAALLHSQRHGEQPAHRGIDPVIGAQQEHHQQRRRAEPGERPGVTHE